MTLGIFGASGLGREVNIIARKINALENKWENIVYIDDNESIREVLGVPSYTFDEAVKLFPDIEISIAIGEPSTREKIYNRIKQRGIKLANIISPGVYIDDSVELGEGVTICEGATITSCVKIADNVYIHPHAVIGHDIQIGRHSTIGSNSEIGGADKIGERVFIGFMAGTLQGLNIGDDVEISAGSIVFRDIPAGMIVMGNPARVIRRNEGLGVFSRRKYNIMSENTDIKPFSLNYEELQKYQPNRYPFLLIDYVDEVLPGKYAKGYKNLTNNEWYFPAHFPGNPNMPGCLQVEAMSQMLTVAITTCEGMEGKVAHGYKIDATFHEEVHPGDRLDIEAEVFSFKRGLCKGHVKASVHGKLVAEMDNTIIIPEIFYQFRPKPVEKGI